MADDQSRKAFIIKHMNNDHARSLSLYLRAYCAVSASAAQSPTLEDLRLTDMIISARGSRYIIPFTPPLASLSETRARVVAMHKESLRRLNLSDTKVTSYIPPQGAQVIGFALCLATLVGYSRRANFEPGSLLYDTLDLGARFPGFTEFSVKWQPWVFGSLAGAHAFEAVFLLGWMRLRKHGVKIFSGLWWTWMVLGFVEGFPAWMRFDAEVKRIESEGEHEKST
ncbi:hypothetical protein ASPVEDRAFT_35975 [Aspergillus versicolor CBS 583.65]|uniref:DUF2470 domain-containing protein n=1 Tax=Aspergillus versicolor CBS 583.65 TaxID=1036611 RepID=A0A1L9P4Z9_ASPVE|nr:uncharacterized protein ASPVEDRAFT_35975 [Aspergillus versicolor CBS 583.65]OJI96582.1 hypothetical protein ASPVEDRAFT_35975 [Aspergillus versicolor CBS 583.65]